MRKKVISICTILLLLLGISTNAYADTIGKLTVLVHIPGVDTKVSPRAQINIYDMSNTLVDTRNYDMNYINWTYMASGGAEMPYLLSNYFNLPGGDYKLEVKAAYFDTYTENVSVTTGGAVTIDGSLNRKIGTVKVKVKGRDVLGTTNGEYKLVNPESYTYGFSNNKTVNNVYLENLSDDLNKELTVYLERERISPQPDRVLKDVYVKATSADPIYDTYSMGYGTGNGRIKYTDENGEVTFDDFDMSFLNYLSASNSVEGFIDAPYFGKESQVNIFVKPPESVLGSVTVKYRDKDTYNLLEPAIVKSNLDLGTYSYTAKSFNNYTLVSSSTQSATLTSDNRSQTIIFDYKKNSTTTPTTPVTPTIIKGSTTIQYINEDTGALLEDETVKSNLDLGTYSYTAKNFENFNLDDDKTKSATLTERAPNQTITFNYKKKTSSPSHHHTDKDPDPVIPKLIPEEPVKPIITPTPTPIKKSIKGAYVVKYIDESGNVLALLDEKSYKNLDLGSYTELAKSFDGYNLNDENKKSITLNEDNLNGVIEFKYNKLPVELPKTGDNSKTNATLIILLLTALSLLLFILKKKEA